MLQATLILRGTSKVVLKNKDNWFVFHDFVFYLEFGQQKGERYVFSFSDVMKLNKTCNKPEKECQ
jgi:hypothetical protein